MISLPKPEVILTHESDLDGLISGLLLQKLALQLFGATVRIEAYHNHNWRHRPLQEASAWVCDMSFDKRLDKPNWVVIDHHPTDVQPRSAVLFHNPAKSASLLCYELCKEHGIASDRLDRLVHLSDVADLFVIDSPDFILATDYANLVKSYGFWNLHHLIGGDVEKLLDHPLLQVMQIKRQIEDPLGFEWSKQNVTEIGPSVGLVNNIIGNTNLIVHRLLEERATPFSVLMTIFRRGNGMILVSLRSRNGEAIKVAEKLQGGGHPNACGATLPRSVQYIPDAIDYLRRLLNPSSEKSQPFNSLESAFESLHVK